MKKYLAVTVFIILSMFLSVHAAEYKSSHFIVRDPVLGGIAGYASAPSFQLFSSGDLVLTGNSDSTSFLGRFGFLHFPFVTEPTLSATAADGNIDLSWAASTAGLGFTVSGYEYGRATHSGGPYTFFNVGNVTSTSSTGLTNGTTYYFVVRTLDTTGAPIITSNEVAIAPNGPVSPGGGSSGAVGSAPSFIGVQVNGLASPGALVSILKNAVSRAVTKADATGAFSMNLQEPYDKNILYTLFADDQDNIRSLLLNYPLVVDPNSAAPKIAGVKFAPTIATDVVAIKKGDAAVFKGFALPSTSIEFILSGKASSTTTITSEASGRYTFSLPTNELSLGEYELRVHYPGDTRYSLVTRFTVGPTTTLKTEEQATLPGDCNADHKINIRDFSILAFWYGKAHPPTCIDTNHDGTINLVDFSILAFYWTGS